jgi:beta-glucanase (GH16 family)
LDGSEQGNAVITTKRVTSAPANSGQCLAAPCRFVSGRFDTQGKVSFQYGYIEARIKMPVGGTNWPAFWALGDSITEVGWPLSGEIDIAEQGGDRPTRNSSAVHYSNQDIATCCDNHRYVVGEILDEANYQSDFHTYGMAWTPDLMQFYVDRELYWTVYPGNMGQHYWVFNEPFFLILNNATGPFGGNYTGWQTSETKIDYVRAWQLDGEGTVIRH